MRELADEKSMAELVNTLAAKVIREIDQRPGEAWALVGVRSRGDLIAQRLADQLDGRPLVGVGSVDITLYRDDLSEIGPSAVVQTTDVPFAIDDVNVVLVDDVLMTGRSIRAALQAIMDLGRPRRVWLSVLVDRGGRQLPITPDHVALDLTGKTADAACGGGELDEDEKIVVRVKPHNDRDAILVQRVGEQA